MPNLARGISGAAGALAESYGNIEKEKIAQRHRLALEKVKDKYRTKARKDEQIHDLHKQEQASKYRISEYDLERTDKASDRELEYTRGLEATEKKYAHEIEKTKITAASRQGEDPALLKKADAIFENLVALNPDADEDELYRQALKEANQKKDMSPAADIRDFYTTRYQALRDNQMNYKLTDEEVRERAKAETVVYAEEMHPDFDPSRDLKKDKQSSDRFKKGHGPLKSHINPESPAPSREDRLRELY